jgi:hypothetical protein
VVSLKSQSGVEVLVGRLEQGSSGIPVWAVLPRAVLSFKGPLLLVASLAGALGSYLLFYAAYNLLTMSGMIALSLRNALRVDQQRFEEGMNP